MAVATVGLIFAVREFLSWFLKTNAVIDEVIRLEALVKDLQGDLAALEGTVTRLQTTAGVERTTGTEPTTILSTPAAEKKETKPQFRLNH